MQRQSFLKSYFCGGGLNNVIHRDVLLRFLTIPFMKSFEEDEFSSDKNGEGPGIMPCKERKQELIMLSSGEKEEI